MTDDIKNIFISHIHEDDSKLAKLKDLVKPHGMAVRDYSINSDKPNQAKDPDYIKNQILAPQIDQCSVMVVYISPGTKESAYVDWEIEYAQKNDKRIVGVWEYGEKECEVPAALDKYADAVVGWNGANIVDAINGEVGGWESPSGEERDSRPIKRYDCT